jgi:hypothetical protein
MSAWIKVEVDARDAIKGLEGIAKEQFPFAYAAALTETAKLAQIAVRDVTRDRFKLHGEYIPRGILVESAKKKDVQTMRMAWSAVFTSDAITPFMALHETGGKKLPRGRALSVPGEGIEKYRFKTARGAVATRWRPKVLLEGYTGSHGGVRKGKGRSGRGKAFIIPERGASPAKIARRKSRAAIPLEILYVFTPSATIKATWGFEEAVRRVADKMFKKVFEHKWSTAIEEAK